VRTHAQIDATPGASPAKFPLLVFSHGYTASSSAYTALLEDLASHGYVVLSLVHPYEATAARLADSRVVSLLDGAGTPRREIRGVFEEWGSEDETMAAVTRAADEEEQLRLLRGYRRPPDRHSAAALGGRHEACP
jgi:alpha-beta hydrolase superfamily lysophospholipase